MRNRMRSGARHTDHGLNMRDVYSHSQSHISASRSLWLVVVHRNSARFCYPPLVRDRESDRLTKSALVWTRYKSPCSLLKPQPSAQMCTCAEAAKAVGSRHARPRRTRHAERGARPRPALWLPRVLPRAPQRRPSCGRATTCYQSVTHILPALASSLPHEVVVVRLARPFSAALRRVVVSNHGPLGRRCGCGRAGAGATERAAETWEGVGSC